MTCQDWRDAPAEVVVPLYEAEGARWRDDLGWDMCPSWAIVEEARAAGHLPGWLARDGVNGPVVGWTFFLLYAGTLQIGALNGTSARAIRALLQAIFRSPEASLARELSCFLYPGSAAVQPALSRQRFALRQSLYLVNDEPGRVQGARCEVQGAACGVQGAGCKVRPFMLGDEPGVVRLLSLSYRGVP
ncbi:MAG: hypothetical protein HY654_00890, partial [Acidobacteria bacterium]|nr:hypothetical protein [Acidobacteriota bacterium]